MCSLFRIHVRGSATTNVGDFEYKCGAVDVESEPCLQNTLAKLAGEARFVPLGAGLFVTLSEERRNWPRC